jgi:hypothetical protein
MIAMPKERRGKILNFTLEKVIEIRTAYFKISPFHPENPLQKRTNLNN